MTRLLASWRKWLVASALLSGSFGAPVAAVAQAIDCNRLSAQIAALGRSGGGPGSQYAAAAQKQRAELARTSAYAASIGCDRPDFFLFGNRPPQCAGVNAQIARMQANLQGLSGAAYGGDNGRAALQQRFDAYCRNADGFGSANNFFERLFGGRPDRPVEQPEIMAPTDDDPEFRTTRGGGQALCVRTCDGGFFPASVSAYRRDPNDLQQLCSALCPGTETKLYTRVPGREISTAVSADGEPYTDLPNALKFEKAFDKSCSCKPADKSWVEALADAERLLGEERRGDILVTPEKAEELSRVAGPAGSRGAARKFDPRAIAKAVGAPAPVDVTSPALSARPSTDAPARTTNGNAALRSDSPGADPAKPPIRVIPR